MVDEEDEDSAVTRDQFERLASQPDILRMLKSSPDLRRLVTEIDGASDPERVLDAVRSESNANPTAVEFRKLVDEILKVTDASRD